MTEAEGRNTWRTDRYSPCPRRDAGTYLAFLAAIGYQLSTIEKAVAEGTPYGGDVTPAILPAVELGAHQGADSDTNSQVGAADEDASEIGRSADAAA